MHNEPDAVTERQDSGQATAPSVSVVIPTYNRLGTLPRALESVLRQTYDDIEVIVVDDCSADGSWEYLQSISDPRLRVVRHETNRGGSAARNTGIKAARADLIAFQDSDDEWLVTKLATQIEEYRRVNSSEFGAIYCPRSRMAKENSESMARAKCNICRCRVTIKPLETYLVNWCGGR